MSAILRGVYARLALPLPLPLLLLLVAVAAAPLDLLGVAVALVEELFELDPVRRPNQLAHPAKL